MKFEYLKKVSANMVWLLCDKVCTLFANLFVLVVVANFYGATEYGLYQYALSVNTVLEVIVLLIDKRVVKKRYDDYDTSKLVYNATLAKLFLSTCSLVLGIFVTLIFNKGAIFNLIFLLMLLNSIVTNLGFGMENHFEYVLSSKKVVIASSISKGVGVIFQLGIVFFKLPIYWLAVVLFIISSIRLGILVVQYKKAFLISFFNKVDFSLISSIIKESLPLAIAATAATIYTRCDSIMIESMLGYSKVGIYSIATQLNTVLQILVPPVQISIFPKMIEWYNKDKEMYYKQYSRITCCMTGIGLLAIVSSFLALPVLFTHFFNPEYMESYRIFQIQSLGTLFIYNATLRSSHYTIVGESRVMMISQLIAVFLNVLLNFLLIPLYGIKGAAIATVMTHTISLLFSNYAFICGKEIFTIQCNAFNPVFLWKNALQLKKFICFRQY